MCPFRCAKPDGILRPYLEMVTFNYRGNDHTATTANLECLFNLKEKRHPR